MRCRYAVLLFLAVLVAGLAPWPVAARELKFGFTPVLSEADMRADFEPLMSYLSDAIGEKVVLYVAKNYGDLRTQMEAGAVDIGSFSPFAYVDAARRQNSDYRAVDHQWLGNVSRHRRRPQGQRAEIVGGFAWETVCVRRSEIGFRLHLSAGDAHRKRFRP
jgi:ABC transporter, phosphonate, periplasmic substrate-binding protein